MFAGRTKTEIIVNLYIFQFLLFAIRNNLFEAVPSLDSFRGIVNVVSSISLVLLYLCVFIFHYHLKFYSLSLFIVVFSSIHWIIGLLNHDTLTIEFFRDTVFYCLSICILLPEMDECDTLFKRMKSLSYYLFGFILILALIYYWTVDNFYSITFGNLALVVCCFLICRYFEDDNKISLLLALCCLAFMVMYSSRTNLYCALIYLLLKIIASFKERSHLLLKFLSIVICLAILLTPSIFENYLSSHFLDKNLRNINLLLSGNAMYLSGREEIYSAIIDEIKRTPFIGAGLGATYGEHSILLSVVSNFGIVVGPCVLIWYFYNFINELIKTKEGSSIHELLLIYGCILFPRIIYNGSIWSQEVFTVLALVLAARRIRMNQFEF